MNIQTSELTLIFQLIQIIYNPDDELNYKIHFINNLIKTNKEILIKKISNIFDLINENFLPSNLNLKENINDSFEKKFKKEIEGNAKVLYDDNNCSTNFEIPFNLKRDNSLITFKIESTLNDEENCGSDRFKDYEKFFNDEIKNEINSTKKKNYTIQVEKKINSNSVEKKNEQTLQPKIKVKNFYKKKIYDIYITNKVKKTPTKKKKIISSSLESKTINNEKNSRNKLCNLCPNSSCKKMNSKINISFQTFITKDKNSLKKKNNRSLDNNYINHNKNLSFNAKGFYNNNYKKNINESISPINKNKK